MHTRFWSAIAIKVEKCMLVYNKKRRCMHRNKPAPVDHCTRRGWTWDIECDAGAINSFTRKPKSCEKKKKRTPRRPRGVNVPTLVKSRHSASA